MKMPFLFLIVLFVLGAACSSGDDQSNLRDLSKTTTAQVSEPKIDGARLYKIYCVTCHGLYGDMGSAGAFDLTVTELSLEQKIEVITKGRNTMTPFEGLLSPEQIAAVAEYTQTLKE